MGLALASGLWVVPSSSALAGPKRRVVVDLRADSLTRNRFVAGPTIALPLTIHVATDGGDPVASRRHVESWVRRANSALARANIEVDVRSVRWMPPGWHSVTNWRDRRDLAHYAPRDGTIHVFVIEELDTRRRRNFRRRIRGMHWRYRGAVRRLRAREYVVVTIGAPMTTFAHELGHLFGLGHATADDNIMCSCRRGASLAFTDSQHEQMRSGAARFVGRQLDGVFSGGRADVGVGLRPRALRSR